MATTPSIPGATKLVQMAKKTSRQSGERENASLQSAPLIFQNNLPELAPRSAVQR
jgi:hypothetical protein